MSRPRLLGASMEPLADLHETQTRSSQLFVELGHSFPIAGFVRPVVTGPQDWLAKLASFHADRDAWRGRAALSPRAFRRRTELVGGRERHRVRPKRRPSIDVMDRSPGWRVRLTHRREALP